jgi:hypothetical protein
MRLSYLVVAVVVWVTACATTQHLEISSTIVTRWADRDISELITAIGPYDTTSIQGDSRSYYWNRFGNCAVTVLTSRDDKILKIDVQGTTQVCSAYMQKMGDSQAPSPKQ